MRYTNLKIKTFCEETEVELDNKINTFLSSLGYGAEIRDVKITCNNTFIVATVLYEPFEELKRK